MAPLTQDSDGQASTRALELLRDLQRYAGWLGRDSRCTQLRANVEELGGAITTGADVSRAVLGVQAAIKSVNSSAIVPLLRATMRKLCIELGEPGS